MLAVALSQCDFMKRGQAAVEYILLVALGLFLIIIAFTIAFYVKTFTDATLADIAITRNETIAMLLS
jgi:uncharacterized protein (UPF0333 family)